MDSATEVYPFAGEVIDAPGVVKGWFSETKEIKDNKRWILKEIDPFGEGSEEKFREFVDSVKRHDELLKKFGGRLNEYIPSHHLVFFAKPENKSRGYIAMRRVEGEELIKMDKIPDVAATQLEDIILASLETWRTTEEKSDRGCLPDIIPPSQEGYIPTFGNMIWGEIDGVKKLYFVDTFPMLEIDDFFAFDKYRFQILKAIEILQKTKKANFSGGFVDKVKEHFDKLKVKY